MNNSPKNKLLTWLVALLLIANAVTIAMFWLGRHKNLPPPPPGGAKDFMVRELKLDSAQQDQLEALVKAHRQAADSIRKMIKVAKDSFFALVKQPNVSDSIKLAAARAASKLTEQLDVITLDHFQKIRALCTADQQKKFDDILLQVTTMMAPPPPPHHPGGKPGPPPPPMQEGEKLPTPDR